MPTLDSAKEEAKSVMEAVCHLLEELELPEETMNALLAPMTLLARVYHENYTDSQLAASALDMAYGYFLCKLLERRAGRKVNVVDMGVTENKQ